MENNEEKNKRKVGRPFKGQVEEQSKEPNVPERRSVLRGFKKFYAKKEYQNIEEKIDFLKKIHSGLSVEESSEVEYYIMVCKQTQSADHYKKKTEEFKTQILQSDINLSAGTQQRVAGVGSISYNALGGVESNHTSNIDESFVARRGFEYFNGKYKYEPLVGDPCYRYNKCVKEKFFKNLYLSYLFTQFIYYNGEQFIKNKKWRRDDNDDKHKNCVLKDIIWEFICLAKRTIDSSQESHKILK